MLHAHRGGKRVPRLLWLPVADGTGAGGMGAPAEVATAPGLR